MPEIDPSDPTPVGPRAVYDAIAQAYDRALGDELAAKPLDRGLLAAFIELVGRARAAGRIADVGCGPGHVTRHLAHLHPDVVGIDLSPGMIAVARRRAPDLQFMVGSMLDLPVADDAWAGVVALYSIIHLSAEERGTAFREFARVLRPGGRLLVAFHVESAEVAAGEVKHVTTWFDRPVTIDGYFLDPGEVTAQLESVGLAVTATLDRQPDPDVEYPSRRCYLLAQRR